MFYTSRNKIKTHNYFVVRKYSCISALEISGPCIKVGFPKFQTKATDSKSTNTLHLSMTRLRVCNCSFVCAVQQPVKRLKKVKETSVLQRQAVINHVPVLWSNTSVFYLLTNTLLQWCAYYHLGPGAYLLVRVPSPSQTHPGRLQNYLCAPETDNLSWMLKSSFFLMVDLEILQPNMQSFNTEQTNLVSFF